MNAAPQLSSTPERTKARLAPALGVLFFSFPECASPSGNRVFTCDACAPRDVSIGGGDSVTSWSPFIYPLLIRPLRRFIGYRRVCPACQQRPSVPVDHAAGVEPRTRHPP